MRYLFVTFTASLMLFAMTNVYAEALSLLQIAGSQDIPVYQQPDLKDKTLTDLRPGQTIIPLLSQKDWCKIANPQNGEVGWVQKTDLAQATKQLITVTKPNVQQYVVAIRDPGYRGGYYSVVQYANSQSIDQKKLAEWLKQVDTQHKAFDRYFDTLLQGFNETFRSLAHMPVIQPVIIVQDISNEKSAKTEEKSWWRKLFPSKNE